MFDVKKEVPSLGLCRKLKELGYPQEGGGWYWVHAVVGYGAKDVLKSWGWELKFAENPREEFGYVYYLETST